MSRILGEIDDKNSKEEVGCTIMISFYENCLECIKEISWLDDHLDISRYLSNVLRYLRQSSKSKEIN